MQILTEREAMESFDMLLDECNPEYQLGCLSFSPSEILKKLDPIAYREDFLIFVNCSAEDGVFYVEGYTDDEMETEDE
jgi:hypothetical protein